MSTYTDICEREQREVLSANIISPIYNKMDDREREKIGNRE